MKRLVIIAVLLAVAIGIKAQTPSAPQMETDSVSVMLRHLANTNAEVAYLNESLRLHSQLALGSFALEGIGVACLLFSSPNLGNGIAEMEPLAKLGLGLCVVGGIGFICSYIPIWTSKVRMDNRGLVISLP